MPAWSLKNKGGSGTGDWFLDRLATARVLLPDAGFDTILGDDFGGSINSQLLDVVGVASATPSETDTGGVVVLDVGDVATTPCSARLALTGSGSHVHGLGSNWYMAALVKITQPLDAEVSNTRADAVCLFGDVDNQVSIGIFGNFSGGSPTNWIGVSNNAGSRHAVLGPPLDSAESPVWHLFESWLDVTTGVHFAIDGQEFNDTIGPDDVGTTSARLSLVVQRTAVGDSAIVNVDKYCVIVPSPTVGEP